jgi:hypothetical protein
MCERASVRGSFASSLSQRVVGGQIASVDERLEIVIDIASAALSTVAVAPSHWLAAHGGRGCPLCRGGPCWADA